MAIGNIKAAAAAQQHSAANQTAQSQGQSPTSADGPLSASFLESLFSSSPVSGSRVPGTDLIRVTKPQRDKTICVIYGPDGSGKTSFVTGVYKEDGTCISAGCPGPLQILNFDRRGEEAAYQAEKFGGKTIYYLDAALPANINSFPPEQAKQIGQYVLDRATRAFDWGAEEARNSRLSTICIDGAKELSDIIQLAMSGTLEKLKPKKGERNNFPDIQRAINFQGAYFGNKARECRFNLVFLARAKAENWPEPDLTWDCHKTFHQAADWSALIRLSTPDERIARATEEANLAGAEVSASRILQIKKSGPAIELKIGPKSGYVLEEIGRAYTAKDWGEDGPFAYACSRLIPRTEPEDWK